MKEIKPEFETFARIKVVGVGGSGNHAISRMIEAGLSGVDFVAINTDSQDLHHCKASEKIHIGKNLTRGLGAGMNPDVGRQASEENRDEIQDVLKNTDMVFITCGLGGGTGTGAAPIVAEAAKEAGALTVAVVTKPFMFEGMQRKRIAEDGLESLTRHVDTIITIPNDKILQVIDKKTLLLDSFKFADDILRQGIQGISDLITIPGIVNVDFADVKSIMQNTGSSLMGIGKASGENRAVEAAKQAINSPLLELSIDGANGVLFNVSGGADLTMMEINEAASIITEFIDDEARVIFGAVTDENLKKGEIKVTVIATGFSDGNNNNKRINIDNVVDEEINFMNKEANCEKLSDETVFTDENIDSDDTENNGKKDKFENANKKNEVENNAFSSKISPVSTDDEYDVPAFIRKKIKKEE
ncbi:MAG: cell division protein FtsZ [Candidatus Pacebacteria bacterium]|nr:cell division protein FtsZ [Candidatus Paceibacterota bacterium]